MFRSFNKGSGIKSISPDVTNTDKGAASALTESPKQAGVLYVGTTDGAVWMTKDGGNEWVAVYSKKEKKKEPEKESDQKADEGADKDAASGGKTEADTPAEKVAGKEAEKQSTQGPAKKIDGVWVGKMISDRFPEGQEPTITFSLKSTETGEISGDIETRRGPQDITSGKYNPENGELTIVIETQRGRREFEAEVKGDSMTGEMSMRDGQFVIEFDAKRQEDPGDRDGVLVSLVRTQALLSAMVVANKVPPHQEDEDPVSGEWDGVVRSDQLPGGEIGFTLILKMDDKKGLTGSVESPQGEFTIDEGQFTSKSRKIYFSGENDDVFLDFEAVLKGKTMSGDVSINDSMSAEFEATMSKPAKVESADDKSGEEAPEKMEDTKDQDKSEAKDESQERPQPGFLGVQMGPDMSVANVIEGSAAEKAGVLADDKIVQVDGNQVADVRGLLEFLRDKNAGNEIVLVVERDGESKELKAVLGKRPEQGGQAQGRGQNRQRRERPEADRPEVDDQESASDTMPSAGCQ